MYFQVCSNSAYPEHSGEPYRTNGPLVIISNSKRIERKKKETKNVFSNLVGLLINWQDNFVFCTFDFIHPRIDHFSVILHLKHVLNAVINPLNMLLV